MAQDDGNLVTKSMTFSEIMQKYPETASVFLRYQLRCIGCPISAKETVEQGARMHRINLNKLLEDLNKAAIKRI